MKIISRNLLIFALLLFIYTVLFRFGLGELLTAEKWVWGLASEGWFLLGLHSAHETIRIVHITLLIWSGFLILHLILFLILRRRTIKGIHKTNIFE